MKNRYEHILRKSPGLMDAVRACPPKTDFDSVAVNVAAPVVCMYTAWVLREAQRLKIKRLYFFARDGFLMYHVAKRLCEKKNYPIQCSYFYCSRYALRLAAYRFHDDTAFEKLFLNAYRQTPSLLLKRAGLTEEQRRDVYHDIGLSPQGARESLGRKQFDELCGRLRASPVFLRLLDEISDAAYENTMSYIRQEGMEKYQRIGIVDLGWTGSMQHTLRRLLDSQGIRGRLYGFYVGCLGAPPEAEDSSFFTWLFGAEDRFIKAWFSHNVLECLCSAPHGMTLGYQKKEGKVSPVFAPCENDPHASEKLRETCLRMVEKYDFCSCAENKQLALALLRKLMFSPTKEECLGLQFYRFCDDVGEQYHGNLIQSGKPWDFRKELLPFKLFFRDRTDGFYWYYGSVQASNLLLKPLYRYADFLTRYIILLQKRR